MAKVAVIGSGAWGSALACVSVRAGHDCWIWGRSSEVVDSINQSHTNPRYLDDLHLEADLKASTDLAETLNHASLALLAIPAQTLSQVLSTLADISPSLILVTACKGIDRALGLLPTQLVTQALPNNPVAALSGPSFAVDVVRGLPTAVTIGSATLSEADAISRTLSSELFRCYSSDDLLGVELGGALKNVLALAVGAARGMGLGASAEAALIARGFAEITRIATRLGARPETLAGLSGLGDLSLTCSSTQSRNFTYGMAMARGEDLTRLKLAEGVHTAAIALKIAQQHEIDAPITQAIVQVLERKLTAREAMHQLLTRPLKREI